MLELTAVPDVGPKTAMVLYRALGVTTLDDLAQALAEGRLREVPGFGSKSEEKLRVSLAAAQRRTAEARVLLAVARPLARQIVGLLRETGVPVQHLEAAGSLRRGRTTIGDMDILCTSPEPQRVIDFFVEAAHRRLGDQPRRQ